VFRTRPRRYTGAAIVVAVLLAAGAALAAPADSTRAAATPSATPSFVEYQKLLDELLTVFSGKGEPLDSRFDYEKFYDQKGRYERLARIKRELLEAPPAQMDARTRRAWAINTYNYLVIETATNNLLVPGRGRLRYKGVRDIRLPDPPNDFFRTPVVQVEGKGYSLDEFERTFIFDGFTLQPPGERPATIDPRVHFAIVCGALGCPPLLPRAYRPDSLETQLDFATRNALSLPRHLRLDGKSGRLDGSAIFIWYAPDFGGREKVFEFVKKYAPAKIRAAIAQQKITGMFGTVQWDWLLNQTAHKKEI
jgi:hypothetical protein